MGMMLHILFTQFGVYLMNLYTDIIMTHKSDENGAKMLEYFAKTKMSKNTL